MERVSLEWVIGQASRKRAPSTRAYSIPAATKWCDSPLRRAEGRRKKQEIAQTVESRSSPSSTGAETRPLLFHSGTSPRGPICIQPSARPPSTRRSPGGGPARSAPLCGLCYARGCSRAARPAAGENACTSIHSRPPACQTDPRTPATTPATEARLDSSPQPPPHRSLCPDAISSKMHVHFMFT